MKAMAGAGMAIRWEWRAPAVLNQLKPLLCRCCQCGYSTNVFDRSAKRQQKNRAAVARDAESYDYLKDKVRGC